MFKPSYSPIPLPPSTQHTSPELASSLQTSIANKTLTDRCAIVENFTSTNLSSLTNLDISQATIKKPNDFFSTSYRRGIGYVRRESTCTAQGSNNQSPQLSP